MQYRPMPNWIGAAIALSTTMGFPFILGLVRAFHAATRATAGDMTAMVEVMEGLAQAGQTGSQSGVPLMFGLVAEAHQALHQPADGLGAADVGLGISAQTSQGFWDGELHRVKGELVLAAGGAPQEAAQLFERALGLARIEDAHSMELRAAISHGRLLAAQGRPAEAHDLLRTVYDRFTEGWDTGDLVAARALLSEFAG